jgi:O-acetyl-ADP-ribose deacetylase
MSQEAAAASQQEGGGGALEEEQSSTAGALDLRELVDCPPVKFHGPIFKGPYPDPWPHVSPLSEAVLQDLANDIHPASRDERVVHDGDLQALNRRHAAMLARVPAPAELAPEYRAGVMLRRGLLVKDPADALVNSANECLQGGGGVDGLIHYYGGASLREETALLPTVPGAPSYYPVKCLAGDAKITSGHNLRARYIIHAVAPYLDEAGRPQRDVLVATYNAILRYVDGEHIRSLALTSIATGFYGYPFLEACFIALTAVRSFMCEHPERLERVTFYIHDDVEYQVYETMMRIVFGPIADDTQAPPQESAEK